MPSTTTSNLERLALDGPIGISVAIAIGLALMALFAWSLWRERRILGRHNTVLFWMLRTLALVTVIWMLLAPMSVKVQTSTTRKAVAIITDVSGSMQTVDPPGTADEIRWAAVLDGREAPAAIESADKAVAAVGIARERVRETLAGLQEHRPETAIATTTSAAEQALRRARQHVQAVATAEPADAAIERLAIELNEALGGAEIAAFFRLSDALREGRTPSETSWRESLPDLEYRLANISRSLHELARKVHDAGPGGSAVGVADVAGIRELPRVSKAARLIETLDRRSLSAVKDQADLRLAVFDQSVKPLSGASSPATALTKALGEGTSAAAAAGTNLTSVLEQINRDRQEQPLAAVFVITDAAHNLHDGKSPRDVAATLADTPVYIVPVGNSQHVRDIDLQSVYAPAVAMRNDDIVIEARIRAYDCDGETCTVQLLQDGEVIDFREVLIDSGLASRSVRFERLMPTVGTEAFQVAVVPLEGELTEENNYGEFEVNVTRSDIKVLLSDELPRWEYRYLAQLFRRDPKIECDELLFHPRMIATGRREESQTFPVTVDEWDQYDVAFLGDLPVEHLPVASQESLIEYLSQRGGTLVLIAGQEHMPHRYADHPLHEILPVQPIASGVAAGDEYAFRVTDEGRDHTALMIAETEAATRTAWDFINRYSPLHAVSEWRQPRPSARTLIAAVPRNSLDEQRDAAASAFLCWQPVGRGRVIYLSGPDTYRLRFLRGDRLHYRFWGQLLRWAIASDLATGTRFVRIRSDKSRYATREEIRFTVRLTDTDGAPVIAEDLQIQLSSGDTERALPLAADPQRPGDYSALARSLPPGVYHASAVGPAIDRLQQDAGAEPASVSFTVHADLPLELVDTRSDRALAQQIAEITHGQVLSPAAVEEVLELTDLEPIVTERVETRPLWIRWRYLWIVFGCLQIEWAIRKWKGLS